MNYSVLLALFCAACVKAGAVERCCEIGDGCRTDCSNPTPTANLVGILTSNCKPLLSLFDYGFGVYPVISLVYNWVPGERAYFEFMDIYAYVFALGREYYYVSVIGGGCPQLYPMPNSTTKFIHSTYLSYSQVWKIIGRFNGAFKGGCTEFVPLLGNNGQCPSCNTCYGGNSPIATYQFNYCPAASFAMPIETNNNTKSAVRDGVNEIGSGLYISESLSNLNDFIQVVHYAPTDCGEPGECKRLNRIKNVNTMIKEANYSIECINPKNKNSGCLLSQSIAQGFTKTDVPFLFTSIVLAIAVPPGCSGITYMRIAGQIYSDSLRVFFLKLFTLCR